MILQSVNHPNIPYSGSKDNTIPGPRITDAEIAWKMIEKQHERYRIITGCSNFQFLELNIPCIAPENALKNAIRSPTYWFPTPPSLTAYGSVSSKKIPTKNTKYPKYSIYFLFSWERCCRILLTGETERVIESS